MSRKINRQTGLGFLVAAAMAAGCSSVEVAPVSVSQALQSFEKTGKSAQRYTIEGRACVLEADKYGVTLKLLGENGEGLRMQKLQGAAVLAREVGANCLEGQVSKNVFQARRVRPHVDGDGLLGLVDSPDDVIMAP